MADPVVFKKGLSTNLPASAADYELLFTEDTHELYRGTNSGLGKISDIYSYAAFENFPALGTVDKLYLDRSTKSIFLWTGTQYQQMADAHDHSNLIVLDLISTTLVEGTTYLTYNGNAIALLSEVTDALDLKADLVDGLIPPSQLPPEVKQTKVVANITTRDAITSPDLYTGLVVWVIDASDDTTVNSGAALYIYDGSAWQKMAEAESMDINMNPYMVIATYDSNSDGIVNSTDKINGVDAAAANTYYGKDASGNIGFFTLEELQWEPFPELPFTFKYVDVNYNELPLSFYYSDVSYDVSPQVYGYEPIEENTTIPLYGYDEITI